MRIHKGSLGSGTFFHDCSCVCKDDVNPTLAIESFHVALLELAFAGLLVGVE